MIGGRVEECRWLKDGGGVTRARSVMWGWVEGGRAPTVMRGSGHEAEWLGATWGRPWWQEVRRKSSRGGDRRRAPLSPVVYEYRSELLE